MNVLILSANTGQGHNSCSAAIKEIFESNGSRCEICDALSFVSRWVSKVVVKLHLGLYKKAPKAFSWGYTASEKHPGAFGKKSPVYPAFKRGAKKFDEYIEGRAYDIIIACHVFAAEILTLAKKYDKKNLKTAFVATDYTKSPGVEQSNLDYYFIPDESLIEEFTIKDITRNKIYPTGIPVRKKFISSIDKEAAREKVGVDRSHRHLMVMCGSMGCGPIYEFALELKSRLNPAQEVSIICGTNKQLKARLDKEFEGDSRFHIYGYVDDVALFMDSADLYFTKPGGLSVAESAAKRLPMVLVNAVSGCEKYNLDFFVNSGGAVTAEDVNTLAALTVNLISDEERLSQMSEALSKAVKDDPAGEIYRILKE